jgi:glyoxylase-like metal-dependent hydrolase (beta-lactamase superfamily II)
MIMANISRRTALIGTAAAILMPAIAGAPARAAAPVAGKQVAGFYRYKVGDIEVTVVTDGVNRGPLAADFVANVKTDDVKAALEADHRSRDIFDNTFTPVVLNTGGKLVLIDTGTGEANFTASKGAAGQFMTNLAAAGIDAKAIDAVVISHYHGDHMNGLLKADNSLAFPNAEILVPANEHKYWMDDGEMSRAPKGRIEGLFKNNRRVFAGEVMKRLRTYEWDKEVVPGVLAQGTPGHSVGHTSFVVSSGTGKVYVQSDVTHVPYLFVRNPGWHAFYDQDAAMAEATRRKVYDMLAAEKMMVQGFHYPFPAHAYIEKSGNGYRETMVAWNPSI